MKRTSALFVFLLAALLHLAACSDSKTDQVALRVAALTYAFEHDEETKNDPAKWLFEIESDFEQAEVNEALSSYPLVHGVVKVLDQGSSRRIDVLSGKRYAYWSVKIRKTTDDEILADVGCVKGGLNGYGQILTMRKKFGRWVVISSNPSWIS